MHFSDCKGNDCSQQFAKKNVDVLTESLYGTVASKSWLANVDMTLSNAISDLSASAAVEQLSVHWKRQDKLHKCIRVY